MGLLERAEQLSWLSEEHARAREGGRLVLLSGEAGAGKSALVEAFLAQDLGASGALVGRCDDLFAPRPLGPLVDIARERPGPLAAALASGDQAAAFDVFLGELSPPSAPVVAVLEDLQWADEATLDLLRYVARRLDRLRCLVIATFRDDVPSDHPLRRASGSLVGPRVRRIHLEPLSVDSVRTLVGDRPIDPVSLHARTGGNPFFVIEVLQGEPGAVPATVRDAVLARTVGLSGAGRDALDAAAVLGRSVTPDLIQAVGDCASDAIEECLDAGLLVDSGGRQSFRHDLARQAVEEAMTPLRRRQLHARALHLLGEAADIVERAHHAIGARDTGAIVDLAVRAADHCVALGAHSAAATLYGRVLEHADAVPSGELLRLLQARARTCRHVEHVPEAIKAGEAALALVAATGDDAAVGEWESWLSGAYRDGGRPDEADAYARRAIGRLEPLGASPALAESLVSLAGHHMVHGRFGDAIAAGERARAMADELHLDEVAVRARNVCGTSMSCAGDPRGIDLLRDAIDLAKRRDLPQQLCLAVANLACVYVGMLELEPALRILDEGIAVTEEHELRYRRNCLGGTRAEALALLGRWDDAVAEAGFVLGQPGVSDVNRSIALTHLGRVRARRGDPGAWEALEEALPLALGSEEAQLIFPVRVARAEAAWLTGDDARAREEVEAAMPLVDRLDTFNLRTVAVWTRRTGIAWEPAGRPVAPIAAILAGDARAVADFWDASGCSYEAADALGDADEVDDLRVAHERLVAMGARPRARMVARRLRDLGARDVPRGPRAATRANAAGLTAREVEVAGLLAAGLTNGEIADRLVLSAKTVEHHVSAVLAKLGVRSRRHVAAAVDGLGHDLAGTGPGPGARAT